MANRVWMMEIDVPLRFRVNAPTTAEALRIGEQFIKEMKANHADGRPLMLVSARRDYDE